MHLRRVTDFFLLSRNPVNYPQRGHRYNSFVKSLLEDTPMMKLFYGLRGTSLNIAIALIAGVDFALFGYDQVCEVH